MKVTIAQFHGPQTGFSAVDTEKALQGAKNHIMEQLPENVVPIFRKTPEGLDLSTSDGYWTIREIEFYDRD